jgi:release factor glutamine methyltransferase
MSQLKEQSWTIGQLMDWTSRFLAQKGIESPHLDARVLLARVLDCKPIDLYGALYTEIATDEVRNRYRELIRRRLEGCPAAYLIGRKEFFSLALDVSPAVLIPRPDSEMVVVECLALAKKIPQPRILDIGTGSGNLAIALARNLPAAEVMAVDLSPQALEVAQANAAKHGVAGRIQFLHGDLFAPVPPDVRFDFIVSNPPYIPHGDIPTLPTGVRDYEPHLALDGGPDGFAVFDRLIQQAPRYLVVGGYLIIEIGSPQEQPARQRIGAHSHYRLAPTIFDASGHPRVLRTQFQPTSAEN